MTERRPLTVVAGRVKELPSGDTLPPPKLDDCAAPDDNTDLNVSTSAHGLTPKAPNDTAKFLRGDASWAIPGGIDLDTGLADHSVKGITITRRADAAIALFDAGYIKSDGDIAKAKADAAGTVPALLLASAAIDSENNGSWLLWGLARDDSWNWTIGGPIYVSAATAGALTQTKPTTAGHQVQIVGYALTADIIFWCPNSTLVEVV